VSRRLTVALGDGSGQATVELVGFLPLIAVVTLGASAALAAATAGEQAGMAAEAGAAAILQDREPEAAARRALPSAVRERAVVAVVGRRVAITVRPRFPIVARHLEARVVAHAGPEPRP
jgi:hypothetical protein